MYPDSIVTELSDFSREKLNSKDYPDYIHNFTLFECSSCKSSVFRLTLEHHTGSEECNFRGVIWGTCKACGYLMRLFTFTGNHRERQREERPECECGNRSFLSGQCERIEGEKGIPGFFDEGVIVGKCDECGCKKSIVFYD